MPRLDEALWVFKGPGYNLEMHLLRMNLDDGKKMVGGGGRRGFYILFNVHT